MVPECVEALHALYPPPTKCHDRVAAGPSWYPEVNILVQARFPDDAPKQGLSDADTGRGVHIIPLSPEEVCPSATPARTEQVQSSVLL